jgi:PTH1 family peptidyl-tRNA hydrolase
MWLLIGLGNPGSKYEKTRHNLGFMAVDRLAGSGEWKEQHKAVVQKMIVAGTNVLVAKPQTFMNLSGESVQALLSWHKIPVERLVVFCDDVALDCGRIRIRAKGSHGGQNGLRNIIEKIGDNFIRIRVGAGKAPAGWDLSDWVLSKISKDDEPLCHSALTKIPELVECLLKNGIHEAMGKYNAP